MKKKLLRHLIVLYLFDLPETPQIDESLKPMFLENTSASNKTLNNSICKCVISLYQKQGNVQIIIF